MVDKHRKTLEQRLAELCDRAEIQDLAIRYAHAVRTKNADMIMSLFADPAATLDLDDTCPHFGDDRYSHDRMRRVYEDGMNLMDPWPIMTNHLIQIEGPTKATGTVCLELRHGKHRHQVAWIGTYEDIYEKVGDAWKFRSRRSSVIYTPMLDEKSGEFSAKA